MASGSVYARASTHVCNSPSICASPHLWRLTLGRPANGNIMRAYFKLQPHSRCRAWNNTTRSRSSHCNWHPSHMSCGHSFHPPPISVSNYHATLFWPLKARQVLLMSSVRKRCLVLSTNQTTARSQISEVVLKGKQATTWPERARKRRSFRVTVSAITLVIAASAQLQSRHGLRNHACDHG